MERERHAQREKEREEERTTELKRGKKREQEKGIEVERECERENHAANLIETTENSLQSIGTVMKRTASLRFAALAQQ